MLRLSNGLFLFTGVVWYGAATFWGAAIWLRWVVILPCLVLGLAARSVASRHLIPPRAVIPLGLVVLYGFALSAASASGSLAFWKTVTFAVTVPACILGGGNLVGCWGRDRVLRAWRWIWRLLLAYSVVALGIGRWTLAPEGVAGPTGNPNMYGAILVTVGLVLLAPEAQRRAGAGLAVEGVTGLTLLLLTRARASMAGWGGALLVAVFLGRSSRRWWVAAGILLIAAASLLLTPEATVRRMEDVLEMSGGQSVFATREGNWIESWDAMLAGLPFGFGWGVKKTAPRIWDFDARTTGYGREEGTSWLPIGEELGIPGLCLWAWIWVSLFLGASRAPPSLRPMAFGALTYYFVLATFEGWLLSPGNWESWAFWTTVGILLATPRVAESNVLSPRAQRAVSGTQA